MFERWSGICNIISLEMVSRKDKLRQFWPQSSRFPYSLTLALSIGFPLHRTDSFSSYQRASPAFMGLSLECLLQQMRDGICYLRGGLCFDLVSLFLGDVPTNNSLVPFLALPLFVGVSCQWRETSCEQILTWSCVILETLSTCIFILLCGKPGCV